MKSQKPKYCIKCGRQFEPDMEVCPACNEKLSPKKPWIAKDEVSTWTVLEKNTGDMQADQMISVLSYYGIPARKYYKGSSQYVSIFTGMTSIGVYVIVPESELERARKILADAPAFDDEGDFDWDSAPDVWKNKDE
ncbi:MAG: hypothetical protein IKD89_01260 [Clostridia bacterium]|nr:hypothetical protein [Clostridia bacterium]